MKIEEISAIYKITNPIGEIYIGQTTDWKKRFKSYSKLHCHTQKLLYRSIKRHEWKNHKIELLEYCTSNLADEKEILYIEKYKSYYKNNQNGLNLTRGGKYTIAQFTKKSRTLSAKSHKKPILQYDLNGNFIREWESLIDLVKKNNYNHSWVHSCLRGKSKRAYNYMWSFKTLNYPTKIEPFVFEIKEFIRKKGINPKSKKVLQYDLDGNFIKGWENIKQAAISLKIYEQGIHKNLKMDSLHAKNFQWKYWKEDYPLKIDKVVPLTIEEIRKKANQNSVKSNNKKVSVYKENGEFYKTFDSIKNGAIELGINIKSLGSISDGIKKNKIRYGYYWRLKTNNINQ
jgi:hypothetical protein